jgi:hypothetical protein
MPDASDVWPTYDPSPPKHVHALGVVTAQYNMLEFSLLCLLFDYGRLGNGTTQHLFANISNNLRLEFFKNCVNDLEQDPQIKEQAMHFADGYDLCTENRNTLAHSMTLGSAQMEDGDLLLFSKRTKSNPVRTNNLNLRLADIRRVADEIFAFHRYGHQLHVWLLVRTHGGSVRLPDGKAFYAPSPEKPLLPSKLSILRP